MSMSRATGTVSVIGLGYIGLPTAAMFAARQVQVIGVDVNPDTVARINEGEIHIVEPDLDIVVRAAVAQGFLRATTMPEAADAYLIAVPTPFKGPGHDPDLSYIQAAAQAISPVLEPGVLVVLESTVPPGATEQMAVWLAEARPDLSFPHTHGEASDIRVAHCPERVLPGKVMRELVSNDRIIGGLTQACSDRATQLYRTFVAGDCITTDARTAELAKLTENSFRDINIAFANELSLICERLDVDVWELIQLANRHPRVNILQPGPGVGGHCIAIDPWFVVASAPDQARLIRMAREVNDAKPAWVIDQVQAAIGAHLMDTPGQAAGDVVLACYGLAFKADIDDLRESPALDVTLALAQAHPGPVLVVEPNIATLPPGLADLDSVRLVSADEARAQAQVHVILVDHSAFRAQTKPDGRIVDTRGLWRKAGGLGA